MKIFKEIKFKGVCGKLECKKGFRKQSVTKYLRLILVFTLNGTLREKFNCSLFEGYTKLCNEPQRTNASHSEPQRPTRSHYEPQGATTTYNNHPEIRVA